MCGIAGVVRRGGVERSWLTAMAGALAHRGPDGEGVACLEEVAFEGDLWQAGLAHRRLAVFDPTPAGAQPMTSRSGRTTLVLNGEIYNHPELRRRLRGFPWRTGTDTEVLVELLEHEGPRVLECLNGMFAFAAWERDRRRLLVARDRLGVKPLYYRADKDGLCFASELRALLEGPRFERRLDRAALSAYLDLGFVPAPHSALEGVSKLPPGALLEWSDGETRVRRWWSLPAAADGPGAAPRGWRETLYLRLVEAVRLQLRSDVPIGCFLSGGVDSTLLAALAMRERGSLDTFSLSFPEYPRFDEAAHAREAARRLGTQHRVVAMRSHDVAREAPEVLASMDEPFADSSLLPVHVLSRAARERVTVALAGDGADELFAGYRRYGADRWLARWQCVPPALRHGLLEPLLRRIPEDRSTPFGEAVRRARKVIDADGLDEGHRQLAVARLFGEAEKRALAPGLDEAGAGLALLEQERLRCGGRDALDTQLRVDLALGLPDDMLTKVDRASMHHGLEVRVPFLDHHFVEHAALLPSRLKLNGGRSKAALLDVFGASIPASIRRRAKSGFDAPMTDWLRGPLRGLVHEALSAERLARLDVFDGARVSALVDEHERGAADHAWRIWSLVVLSDWSVRSGVS